MIDIRTPPQSRAAAARVAGDQPRDVAATATLGVVLGLDGVAAAILVEGVSDQVAVETLAERRGRDLAAEGVSVVPIGGAQAIGKVLRQIRADGRGTRLAGLCDAAEEAGYRAALDGVGLGPVATRQRMESLGFYTCEDDLEDELVRALGADAVQEVLARHGDLSSFRTFQKQPHWHGRPVESQLRRFFGSSAGKIRYARPLVEALDLARVPRPLDGVLGHVRPPASPT